MAETAKRITLPDGRELGYARFGKRDGAPVIFNHGFPASRLEGELWSEAAGHAGVSLIAPDRPGFGLSSFRPERTILDWPEDVAALAAALQLDRFWIVGGSAGCPYALACTHRLRERVLGAALVAGLGPTTEKAATRQMGAVARAAFALARHAPPVFRLVFGGLGKLVARRPALNFSLNEATPPDQEMLAQPEIRAIIEASIREAFHAGTAGAVHELALLARPWGFGIDEITTPVCLWHGTNDGVTPHAMSEFLAGRAPNAELRLVAGEGHLSLPVRHGAEILETLISSG